CRNVSPQLRMPSRRASRTLRPSRVPSSRGSGSRSSARRISRARRVWPASWRSLRSCSAPTSRTGRRSRTCWTRSAKAPPRPSSVPKTRRSWKRFAVWPKPWARRPRP
ncbi:MAG: hypothetical protein AVDCRST_MAG09-1750, partial [uncultured Sphingomonas sp.]